MARTLAYALSFPLFLFIAVWLAATLRVGAWPLFAVACAPAAVVWLAWLLQRSSQSNRPK